MIPTDIMVADIKRQFMETFGRLLADGTTTEDEIDRMVAFEVEGIRAAARAGSDWCVCISPAAIDEESYYRRDNGRHGWFHDPDKGGCGGITQTG